LKGPFFPAHTVRIFPVAPSRRNSPAERRWYEPATVTVCFTRMRKSPESPTSCIHPRITRLVSAEAETVRRLDACALVIAVASPVRLNGVHRVAPLKRVPAMSIDEPQSKLSSATACEHRAAAAAHRAPRRQREPAPEWGQHEWLTALRTF
jgi:hypothetical protein